MRFGQRRSVETIFQCLAIDQRYISIVLPTRYGKSDVIRMVAFICHEKNISGPSLVLNSSTLLRDQLLDPKKIAAMLDRYPGALKSSPVYAMLPYAVVRPNANGEALLSTTIQMVSKNMSVFTQWVNSVYRTTGRRVLVFIDEAHTGSDRNTWGSVAKELVAAGATCILLTATPYRSQGEIIVGFNTRVIDEEEVTRYVTRDHELPNMINIDMYTGCKQLLKLEADYEYTFEEAWNEEPSPIAKLEYVPFEVRGTNWTDLDAKIDLKLSDFKAEKVKKELGHIVRDPIVIRTGCESLVRKLNELRERFPELQGITFSGNDNGQDDDFSFNAHAKAIKATLAMVAPNLRVGIATSTTEDLDGQNIMTAFANGEYDVVIVKQYASAGLDVDTLKVSLDLSPVRTAVAYVQRLMRIATVYKGIHGVHIAPAECIGEGLFGRFVVSQGGEATVTDYKFVKTCEKERSEKTKSAFIVDGTENADFGDSDQNWADADMIDKVDVFRKLFPEVVGMISRAKLAGRIQASGIIMPTQSTTESEAVNTQVEIYTLRTKITETMKQAVYRCREVRGLTKDSPILYGVTSKELWLELYKNAKSQFVELKKQNDIAILERLVEHANALLGKWLFQGGKE